MITDYTLKKNLAACLASASSLIAGKSFPNPDLDIIDVCAKNKQQLLVAFSGGPDSTALLLALHTVAPSFNFVVQACHINHGLRGEQADADADFCLRTCQQLGVKCQVINLSLGQRHFSENSLRDMRYQHLQSFAHQNDIAFIITGHTLDDQSETILFNLFRGTGLTGLTGIKACRQLDEQVFLLRPLLQVTKAQCLQFLQNIGIEPCHDCSNQNEIYSRNYIRHKIMPVINERFSDFFQHIDSMRQILTSEDDLLAKLTEQLMSKLESIDGDVWSLETIVSEPLALQRRVIAYALEKREIVVSFARIEKILTLQENDTLNLDENWRVKRYQNKLFWQQIYTTNHNYQVDNFMPVTIKIPGTNPVLSLNMALSIEAYNADRQQINCEYVDLSNIKPPLVLRLREPGDLIRPLGMTEMVKLKKYLHTHKKVKAANNSHNGQILLADQEEVLWLPGGGLSEKIKVTTTPSHSLKWLKLEDSPSTRF